MYKANVGDLVRTLEGANADLAPVGFVGRVTGTNAHWAEVRQSEEPYDEWWVSHGNYEHVEFNEDYMVVRFNAEGNLVPPYPMIPATPEGTVHMGARMAANFLPGMPPELIHKAYSDWLSND